MSHGGSLNEPDHIGAHRHSIVHHDEVPRSERCGCFYCLAVFPPAEIEEWLQERLVDGREGRTALCPHCGIDAVIGSASGYSITPEFLQRMHDYWF